MRTAGLERRVEDGESVAANPFDTIDYTFEISSYLPCTEFTDNTKKEFNILDNFVEKAVAGALLLAASPFMGLYEIYYRAKYHESCIFKQERIGQDEKIFTMYKFKSTKPKVERKFHGSERIQEDLTPEGKILRKFSLDEFLNLINVFLGDMTIFPKGKSEYRPLCKDGIFNNDAYEKCPYEVVRHLLRKEYGQYLEKPSIINGTVLTYKQQNIPDDELPEHEDVSFANSKEKCIRYKIDCLFMLLDVIANKRNK